LDLAARHLAVTHAKALTSTGRTYRVEQPEARVRGIDHRCQSAPAVPCGFKRRDLSNPKVIFRHIFIHLEFVQRHLQWTKIRRKLTSSNPLGGDGDPDRVHVWVGGDMLPGTSPNDPAFFLDPCFVG
jgi:hypothetical protein